MIAVPSANDHEELSRKAEKMTQLATLIQEYPAEAQLIMAAVEDGLSLDPALVLGAGLPGPDPGRLGSGSDGRK